jgi:molecular chaperone DnaJ
VDLTIRAGTQPGELYTIKEKGIKHLRGHGTGSLVVGVRVEIPKKLSKEQQELLEQFARVSGDHVKDPSRGKKKLFSFT